MQTIPVEQLIKDKKAIVDLKRIISHNTNEVFFSIKETFKQLLHDENEDISLIEEDDKKIVFNIYNTKIGCLAADGVSMIHDQHLISKEVLEELKAKNLRDIVYDTDYNKFLAGRIVLYIQEENSHYITAGNFYVNHNKTTMYKSEIGPPAVHYINAEELERTLPHIIYTNLENALFSGYSYWNSSSHIFKDLSDLHEAKKTIW